MPVKKPRSQDDFSLKGTLYENWDPAPVKVRETKPRATRKKPPAVKPLRPRLCQMIGCHDPADVVISEDVEEVTDGLPATIRTRKLHLCKLHWNTTAQKLIEEIDR